MSSDLLIIRDALPADLFQLEVLEQAAFESDRLSRRRFRHWLKPSAQRIFLVAELDDQLFGYGLVLLHKGTRLARLYSLAVDSRRRGLGIGRSLVEKLEAEALKEHRLYMRLEVAEDNQQAINLYRSLGYSMFSWVADYYEDHRNALRMQKRIRQVDLSLLKKPVPWYQQTTDFSCGPAALMMAMASLRSDYPMGRAEELAIWRQATTIYMTSGHGGSHPVGLALAARQRGFDVEVLINQDGPLFVDGVRSAHKKELISFVDEQFRLQAEMSDVVVSHREVTLQDIHSWLSDGRAVIVLISTWRIDGRKAPHWVTVSAIDDECLYVHDPDLSEDHLADFDSQFVPVAREDFEKMSVFGSHRLRTCVILSLPESTS